LVLSEWQRKGGLRGAVLEDNMFGKQTRGEKMCSRHRKLEVQTLGGWE
jgi:hypothetical protein